MSSAQTWDPANYARHARFVSDLGSPVLELLAPQPGERILDLGCGDGVLTKQLVDLGCDVVAVDSSAAQVEAARKLGLDARVMSGEALPFEAEFDAVFSNAVLHWIKRADPMIAAVYRSLKPGGRFVAECGGDGCVQKIRTALVQALDRRGMDGEAHVPWYFPTPGDYATRLERAGFRVDSIALVPRPTPLPGDIIGWLETFAQSFFDGLSGAARAEYLQEVRDVLEPQLRDGTGTWVADYVRLRFAATRTTPVRQHQSDQAAEFLFSYGTLQLEVVQMATFGRLLTGTADVLPGFEASLLEIDDEANVSMSGKTHHPIARFTGRAADSVAGTVLTVTAEELRSADRYEVAPYERVAVTLGSGIRAWVYVDGRRVARH